MAFNLPKSWSPGLALPDYVEAEGIERHAFVTQQAPQGTYDNPSLRNFNSGYAIPQYVEDEGYGQGAYITKWAPRGTYYGPRIPDWLQRPPNVLVKQRNARSGGGVAYTIEPLSGDAVPAETPLPAGYQQYGDQTSAVILAGMKRLPPKRRKKALQQTLDAIDPSLSGRANTIAQRYAKAGMAPDLALEHGLARAMGAGLLGEVLHAGATGKVSTKAGHLALVRRTRRGNGLGALGALNIAGLTNAKTVIASSYDPRKSIAPTAPTATHMVQAGPFNFPADADTFCINLVLPNQPITEKTVTLFPPGTSTVTRVSRPPVMTGCLDVVIGSPAQATYFSADAQAKLVDILSKDCSFSVGALAATALLSYVTAPLAAANALLSVLHLPAGVIGFASTKPCITSSMASTGAGTAYSFLSGFIPNLPKKINQDYIGIEGATVGGKTHYVNGGSPIMVASNPTNGKDYGVWLSLGADRGTDGDITDDNDPNQWGVGVTPNGTVINNPVHLTITWKAMDKNWWENLIAFVEEVIATVVDIAGDVLDFVGDAACKLLSSQAGGVGAVAGGAAIGGGAGAQAGAAGSNVAKAVCGAQAPPLIVPQQTSLILPLALLGVGGLFVAVAAKKKKKKKGH